MEGITREFEILKHLGSKVTKKNAEFKLSEEQRSIEELEHYIVTSFPAQISLMVEGIRNLDKYMEKSQAITKFTWKRFVIELNKALRAIKKEKEREEASLSIMYSLFWEHTKCNYSCSLKHQDLLNLLLQMFGEEETLPNTLKF